MAMKPIFLGRRWIFIRVRKMKILLVILPLFLTFQATAETAIKLPWESGSVGGKQPQTPATGQTATSEEDVFRGLAGDFLDACQSGKWDRAYNMTDADYRRSVTMDQFRGFLNQWPAFSKHGPPEFQSVRNHRGIGLVDIVLHGAPAANVEFQLRENQGGWAISLFGVCGKEFGVFVARGQSPAAEFGGAAGTPPVTWSEVRQETLNPEVFSAMSSGDLRMLRNEIFARNGLIFSNNELRNYFSAQKWYHPRVNNLEESDLPPNERANLKAIVAEEKRRKQSAH